jgi:hypothetical protein
MSGRVKTGRLASAEERARAQKLVDGYAREFAYGGSFVVNPWAPEEDQVTAYTYPAGLLDGLERFARTGTFKQTADTRSWTAKRIVIGAGKRDNKAKYVAEKMHVSERTARRLLKTTE